MARKLRSPDPPRIRYAKAIQAVIDGELMISEAARKFGIDRSNLSKRVKAERERLAELQERSAATREDRQLPERRQERTADPLDDQRRVIPPISEFVRTYFDGTICRRHNVYHEPPPFHDEIMASIVDPTIKRLLINTPPGHSKSTCGTVWTTVYEICRDPNVQIGIMSGNQHMASKFLRQIRGYLTDPIFYKNSTRNLIDDFGPFIPEGSNQLGSKDLFYVSGRESADKEPTVEAYGLGNQIQGTRFDRIICDDIALRANQGNPERVQDMFETITQDFETRLDETGELVIIGTKVFPNDIYSLLRDLPGYKQIRYPCIIDDEGRQTLWPEHFGYEAASHKRESMPPDLWEMTYQNSDFNISGATFTPEMVARCHDTSRYIGDFTEGGGNYMVAGVDPAGGGKQAGYTSMVLLNLDQETGLIELVDTVNVQSMKAPQIMAQMYDWAERYPVREYRVEINGLQSQLFQFNAELNRRLGAQGVILRPHHTGGRNKWDEQFGVEGMGPVFANGLISIPWGSVAERRKFQILADQLIRFPQGKPDDLVMALWFAWLGCRDRMTKNQMPALQAMHRRKTRGVRQGPPPRIMNRVRVLQPGFTGQRPLTSEERDGGMLGAGVDDPGKVLGIDYEAVYGG